MIHPHAASANAAAAVIAITRSRSATTLRQRLALASQPCANTITGPLPRSKYLISPAWRIKDTSTAYATVRYIGVAVMASAAFPAYWLALTVIIVVVGFIFLRAQTRAAEGGLS